MTKATPVWKKMYGILKAGFAHKYGPKYENGE